MAYIIYPCPVSFFPSDSFSPVSFCPPPLEIVKWFTLYSRVPYHFPPEFILPPYLPPRNCLIIYTIYPCPISFPPPLIHFAPYHFALVQFYPLEIVQWFTLFTLFTHVPYHFPPGFILPPYHFAPIERNCFLPMSRCLLDSFWPPLQQKLTTGAHPVTVAPLV